jgi:hypothetical protein
LAPKLSLNLPLTQQPCDEEPEPRKICACFEVDPPRAWHYRISLNPHTLVILLQIDPVFYDECKTICEGCYKAKNIFIFIWFSIPGVGHYRWLSSPIRRMPSNNKADYLVHTIRCILDFLQLWIITTYTRTLHVITTPCWT